MTEGMNFKQLDHASPQCHGDVSPGRNYSPRNCSEQLFIFRAFLRKEHLQSLEGRCHTCKTCEKHLLDCWGLIMVTCHIVRIQVHEPVYLFNSQGSKYGRRSDFHSDDRSQKIQVDETIFNARNVGPAEQTPMINHWGVFGSCSKSSQGYYKHQ